MTNCTSKPHQFSPLNRKKIEASFTGGAVGNQGGLLLLREIDKKLGFTKQLSKSIDNVRHQGYVQHCVHDLLKQRIYAIAAGFEDVNDHDNLRQDPCFQTLLGRHVNLASSSTLSRFENALSHESLMNFNRRFIEAFIASHKTTPKELILDFDPTNNKIHGQQEERHYHGYYEEYCYLPLHVFCGEQLLVSLLRPSDIDGSKYAGAILRLLVKRFREVWPEVKIIFRGDSAFARKRILYWCEQHDVGYVVGIAGNAVLKREAKSLVEDAEQRYNTTQEKQRLFTEFYYAARSWKQQRRVIAKVEYHDQGDNLRFIVTNLNEAAQTLYDQQYCPRGNMENGIKQLKLDVFSDRNSCCE